MSGPSYGRFARLWADEADCKKVSVQGVQITATPAEINAAAAAAGKAGQLVGAMVSGYAEVNHDDNTSVTKIELLAANAATDGVRNVLIIVKCITTFAATTNKPIVQIGEEDGDVDKFATIGHDGSPATPAAGDVFVFSGTLAEEAAMQATVTAGTGGAQAGKLDVFVIALPVAA